MNFLFVSDDTNKIIALRMDGKEGNTNISGARYRISAFFRLSGNALGNILTLTEQSTDTYTLSHPDARAN